MRPNRSQDDFLSELKIFMDECRKANDDLRRQNDELRLELAQSRAERMAQKQFSVELLSIVKEHICSDEKSRLHRETAPLIPRRHLDLIVRRKQQ